MSLGSAPPTSAPFAVRGGTAGPFLFGLSPALGKASWGLRLPSVCPRPGAEVRTRQMACFALAFLSHGLFSGRVHFLS